MSMSRTWMTIHVVFPKLDYPIFMLSGVDHRRSLRHVSFVHLCQLRNRLFGFGDGAPCGHLSPTLTALPRSEPDAYVIY
jgi:hypothetical protein